MREPKNQMLGTMVPPLMQLSVNTCSNSQQNNIHKKDIWQKCQLNSKIHYIKKGEKKMQKDKN